MNPYFTPGDIGRTLYLNDKWDIFSDASGQIALVSGAYAIAQNAANAVRLFKNDAYLAQRAGFHILKSSWAKPLRLPPLSCELAYVKPF